MTSTERMVAAMQELGPMLSQVFPDTGETVGLYATAVVGVHYSSWEIQIQVQATALLDAHMTGKIVACEGREVYHRGPGNPPTMHYEAWFPALLPISQMRVKVVAAVAVGKG
jgi:hypothetical protein